MEREKTSSSGIAESPRCRVG